jgi:preprotein translocase subunit YajC
MSSPPILMSMIQAAPAGQQGGTAGLLIGILPWVAIFVIFYMLMIRPQQQRVKQHQAEIASVKKGDEVVTGGGHIGKVTKVGEHEVEVEFASGHRHRVVKSMLSEVRPSGGGKPAND